MAKHVTRLAESWTYIPIGDRELPPEQQTTFRLRPMSDEERVVAQDDVARTLIAEDGQKLIVGRERQIARTLCLTHIVGVENFPVGAAVAWPETPSARKAYLTQFEDELVREVGNEVFIRSTLGALEKNS